MAEIQQGGGEGKKGKPKRMNLRVDFTPMVDMNMLLITFFMFCTTLSKPQIMTIAMPTDEKLEKDDEVKVKESKAITVILGGDDKIFYYEGMPNYEDYSSLKETTYAADGLRALLLERNASIVEEMKKLRRDLADKKIDDVEFKERSKEIKSDKEKAQVVVIKPTEECSYRNLVDALDEMAICSIDIYAIVDLAEGDEFLLENYKTKGAHAAGNTASN